MLLEGRFGRCGVGLWLYVSRVRSIWCLWLRVCELQPSGKEMIETISELMELETKIIEEAFNSIFMSAVISDIGGWPEAIVCF